MYMCMAHFDCGHREYCEDGWSLLNNELLYSSAVIVSHIGASCDLVVLSIIANALKLIRGIAFKERLKRFWMWYSVSPLPVALKNIGSGACLAFYKVMAISNSHDGLSVMYCSQLNLRAATADEGTWKSSLLVINQLRHNLWELLLSQFLIADINFPIVLTTSKPIK